MSQIKISCSVCGCEKYVKHGNTSGGKWLFRCSNGHVWATRSTKEPFPVRAQNDTE